MVSRSHSRCFVGTAHGGRHLLMLPFGPALYPNFGLGRRARLAIHPLAATDGSKGEKTELGGSLFAGHYWIARSRPSDLVHSKASGAGDHRSAKYPKANRRGQVAHAWRARFAN